MKKKTPLRRRLVNYVRRKSPWILHMGCGGCMHRDMEIIVGNEIVKIGDFIDSFGKRKTKDDGMIESMLVEEKTQSFGDFSPREMELYAIHRLKEKKGFVKITTGSGVPVVLTPEHKILVDTIEGPKWIKAKDIKPKDYLYSPRKIKIDGNVPKIIDMLPNYYVAYINPKLLSEMKNQIKKKYNSFKGVSKKLGIPEIRFSDKKRMFRIGELKTICRDLDLGWENISKKIHKITTLGFSFKMREITKEFMYLLGLIASDGYVSFTRTRRHATYKISFCNKEGKLLKLFERGIKKFSPLSVICKDKATNSGMPIRVAYSSILFHIAKYFGLHKNKDIKNIFNLPEEYVASFLAGYFDGDGYISIYCKERKNPRVEIGVSTNHFLTAKRLFLLFKRLGVASKILKSLNKSTSGTKVMYRVSISDHFDIKKFINIIPIKHPFKIRRAREAEKNIKTRTKTMSLFSMAPLICNLMLRDMRIKKGLKQCEVYDTPMVSNMENGGRIALYTVHNMLSNIGMQNNGMKSKFKRILSSEYYLDPVSKIEFIKGSDTVYNISVRETESYVPEGAFVVKNCNGCAIEVVSALSPRSDLERFGCLLKGSPRHADIFLVDGPLTRKVKSRVLRVYNQIPEPKVVLGVGACAISRGIFKDCYNVAGPLDRTIPVDVYVPGCPPKPEAIIQGLLQALEKLEDKE